MNSLKVERDSHEGQYSELVPYLRGGGEGVVSELPPVNCCQQAKSVRSCHFGVKKRFKEHAGPDVGSLTTASVLGSLV